MLQRPILLASLAWGVFSFSGPLQAELPAVVEGQPVPSLAPMLKRVTPGVVNISTKTKIVEAEHSLMRIRSFDISLGSRTCRVSAKVHPWDPGWSWMRREVSF